MFQVTGKFEGQDCHIEWDEGKLTGTPSLVAQVNVDNATEKLVGPVGGPYTDGPGKHLRDPLSALILILHRVTDWKATGDVPEVPSVPDGAIA